MIDLDDLEAMSRKCINLDPDSDMTVPTQTIRELLTRLRAAEAIVRDRTTCFEHAGNGCANWCEHCKAGMAWERRAVEATKP